MLVSVTNRRNGMVERLSFNAWWMAAQHYSGPGFRDLYVQDVSGSWIRKQNAVDVTGKGYVTPIYYAMNDAAKSFFEEVNELISAGYELLSYNIEQNHLYAYLINASGEKTNLGFGSDVVIVGHKKRNEPSGGGGSDWINTTNNINTGIGVGTGVLGGNYGLTANQTFRYAQRINGRVVSAAELTVAHTAQSMKVANALGRVNLVTGVLGSAYSTGKVISDYNNGGWQKVNGLDVADAAVGWVGVGVGVLATIGMVSTPVGWAVGIGTGIYFGARLIYDLSKD